MIEPKAKYLKGEITQLFEFYVTVDRYTNTQLFGLANLMSAYNPYFDYFGITPFREEFKWYKNKTLLVQNVRVKGMEEFVKEQRFYNLVEGTDYADYLVNNTPWQDDHAFIEKRPGDSQLYFNIRAYGQLFGVWSNNGILYVSKKNNPNSITFAGLKSKQTGDEIFSKGHNAHKVLVEAMNRANIRYDTIPIRDMIYDLVNGGFKEA